MSNEKIEKLALEEFHNPNKKFALYAVMHAIDINNIDIKKLVELFIEFAKKNKSKRYEKYEKEERERQKEDEKNSNKKQPSFTESFLKWLLLCEIGYRFFALQRNKNKDSAPRILSKIAEEYYTVDQIGHLYKIYTDHDKNGFDSKNESMKR